MVLLRYDTHKYLDALPELNMAIAQIKSGYFNPAEPHKFREFADNLVNNDRYTIYYWILNNV